MVRTCVGCRQRREQQQLLRCVYGDSGAYIDRHGPGRGAWLCGVICARQAMRTNAFSKAWRISVPASELEELIRSIESATAGQV
ncbi:MAG: YlxR family protein [Actinobacteria bacterium]|nr:YlxR family protein [Ilumatobacteraceae bacterium]MDA0299678.1 YlxR family protein [Actinomycetota bacterium]MDA2961030.1 YlxR family protein [Actinomycetota bacterium]MDA2994526.1 YlxR family protein [Actinomycetota bacterium]